ncbi:MAG: DNA-3-methyladenine glycosylase I [Clostridia bacterium]|nr:DNA-3-methyladenine glycosylase I [Clostridia bacterium]
MPDQCSSSRRCRWCNPRNPLYIAYHDEEWGVPCHDDRRLFEMLVLESFQAGLSWECVLNKRAAFREAFDGFDLQQIISYDDAKVSALLENKHIIRNRLKIRAAISNARIFRELQQEYGSFDAYLASFTGSRISFEHNQTSSDLSDRISRDLHKRGMRFVGTTIIYAYLQAIGVINAHEPECILYQGGSHATPENAHRP